jgi:methyl-accepting chemotaxis protein
VVADEVRSLALRTQESTQEIECVIDNIRQATDDAANQMRKNAVFADQGADTIKATEKSMRVIMGSFCDIIHKNESINTNYTEQLSAVRDVNDMVFSLFNLSQKSTDNTQKVLNNAKDVENLSSKLKMALAQFCY